MAIFVVFGSQRSTEKEEPFESESDFYLMIGEGSILYVVIDDDGAHIGKTIVSIESARMLIPKLLKLDRIKNVKLDTTERAKFGDFVTLYDVCYRLRPNGTSINTLPFEYREWRPISGYLKRVCCYSVDIQNFAPSEADTHTGWNPLKRVQRTDY